MKHFIFRIILFALPLLGLLITEGLLPSFLFTYRPWEALDFQTVFHLDRTFHSNSEINMKSVGELCHHTPYAVKNEEIWKTDILGNRNDTFIKDPDILIIGDSFMAGCNVTQDSTITNRLISELGGHLKVYNIAPGDFSKVDYYLRTGILGKPKLILYSISERFVPMPLEEFTVPNSLKSKLKSKLKNNQVLLQISIFMDKSLRQYSKNWMQSRLTNQKGDGIPGVEGSNMFFFNKDNYGYDLNMMQDPVTDLERTNKRIVSFKHYCDSLGIDFVFLPMPNKSTVYYDYVPLNKQPDYIIKLDSMLKEENVRTINVLNIYNEYRKSNNKLLYHLDDTHWNSNGVHIVTQEIVKEIKKSQKLEL